MIAMNKYQAERLFDRAMYYEDHKMWLHAIQLYHRLITEFPEAPQYSIKLAGVYTEIENYKAAEKVLLSALQPEQENMEVLYALGMVFFHQRILDQALYYFDQVARKQMPDAHFRMGMIFMMVDELHKAERHLSEAISLDDCYYDAYLALGEIYIKRNETLKAIALLQKAVELNQLNWRGMMMLALAYQYGDRKAEALACYRKVASLHASDSVVVGVVTDALIQMREFSEAGSILETALSYSPASGAILVRLGRIALFQSDRPSARQFFLRALACDPACVEAEEHLRFFTSDEKDNL